jgi:hypothetical protein
MRAGMHKCAGILDCAFANEVRPELAGDVELDVDFEGFVDVDRSVSALRRIVELAIGSVASAGIVPSMRVFERAIEQRFKRDR